MHIPSEIGYFFAIFVGITMGILGSGGSILSVPILVYIMGVNPIFATGYSLFIVGSTAAIGGIKKIFKKEFDLKMCLWFGLPSIAAVFLTRKFLVPAIPKVVGVLGSFVITKEVFLMLIFATVMIVASTKMIQSAQIQQNDSSLATSKSPFVLIIVGILIGSLSGLVGAGGGFMIIPALVLLMKMDMKKAIGTSLMIIASQSLIGFLGEISSNEHINWTVLLSFTMCSIIGIFIGNHLSSKINPTELKKGFGWFVLVMGVYILSKEIFF